MKSITPKEIVGKGLFYSIPIYQRLFEWNTDNIVTLMEDLKKEFTQTGGQGDYYIGMLTSTKDNELVDGQQRFTAMMLLGCVLQKYYDGWNVFIINNGRPRLAFSSRPSDQSFLLSLIEQNGEESQSSKNIKMQNGYNQILEFLEKDDNFHDDGERESFAGYVFEHLSFFISNLPQGYGPKDLNKYFERINTTGKNLEQHEILKVKLLSNLGENIDKYMLLWNKLVDVDTLLIRRKNDEGVSEIKRNALRANIDIIFSNNLINGLNDNFHDNALSINDIEMSPISPKSERETNSESKCAISFPYLLLQVLYRKLEGKIDCSIKDFFNPSNLLSIFEEYLPFSGVKVNKEEIKDFMERLFRARLALDICFVRPTDYGYYLDLNMDEEIESAKALKMFESMLYVSSSNYTNYRWFNWLMDKVDEFGIPDANALYVYLKEKADKEFELPKLEELTYQGDNRYWFWRLDFHIWLNRKAIFEKNSKALRVADNYIFKRNRSIEHIAPQTPMSNSTLKWEDTDEDTKLRDDFGNLVMISQGLNSSLRNESYEVKRAHVESYCNGSKSGSIESLKLLAAYEEFPNQWTKETIKKHGEKMYKLLTESYQ